MSTSFANGRSGRTLETVAEAIIRDGGALIRSRHSTAFDIQTKGRGDVVTEVDKAVDRLMTGALTEEYPGWGIMSEESDGRSSDSGYEWIIDPIDGTKNFSMGVPLFAVNLALARDERVVFGMTYDPLRDELFAGSLGEGATLNGQPIHVGVKPGVPEGVVCYGLGYEVERSKQLLDFLHGLWPNVQSLRDLGCAALGLAYVACGRYDAYIHQSFSPWDFAPGLVLVMEAGGVATERDGNRAPLRYNGKVVVNATGVVAANPAVHADLLQRAADHPWRWAGLR
jgi:fructose-1,6-bisphosphatase/inositol monophosphatase family enzyme